LLLLVVLVVVVVMMSACCGQSCVAVLGDGFTCLPGCLLSLLIGAWACMLAAVVAAAQHNFNSSFTLCC
jgi:hypothetical protein